MALLAAVAVAPAFAQGVYETPPSPNSAQSMPQPPNSAPSGARTLPPGSTGIQQMGTVATTRVQPEGVAPGRSAAPSGRGARTQRHQVQR